MIHFYCGSGSPYAWRVWLSLEHKALPYELPMLSFSAGDLKSAAFRAINPRGRVPAITDGDFALFESAAIVEYLEDACPGSGARLLPAAVRRRTQVRRMVREATEPFLAGEPGAADFTVYPLLALTLRMQERKRPELRIRESLGPRLGAWMQRVEALPCFAATYPPHWKAA